MDAARKRADEGYVEDVACAVAAVLRRRPVASTIVLGCGIGLTRTDWFSFDPTLFVTCIASASYLAGAALGGLRPAVLPMWTPGRCVAAALAVAAVVGAMLHRASIDADRLSESIALLAVVGFAFLLGFGVRGVVTAASAAGLATVTLSPEGLVAITPAHYGMSFSDLPSAYAGWLAVVATLVVARRGRWTLALPFAMAAALWRESVVWGFWDMGNIRAKDAAGFALIFVVAGASIFLAVVAGRTAAAIARNESGDAPARLVVRIQRDPWRTALVVVLVGTAFFRSSGTPSPACMFVVVAGMACFAHCAVGTSFATLAPWTAAAALSVSLSISLQEGEWPHMFELTVLPVALIVLYVPVFVGAVVANARTARWPWWGCAVALACEMIVILQVAQDEWPAVLSGGSDLARDAAWCGVVSLLVLAVATTEASAAAVLVASPVASFFVLAGFFGVSIAGPELSDVVPVLVAGPAAALLALGARRVRSMTALPADHPSFELAAARTGSLVPAPNP